MNFIKLLQSRFLLKDMISTSESYTNRSIYCGFDPTASSLHLGHLCALNSLAYASSLSLKPIAILGTATALIGDPSGKTESRPLIDKETIANNTLSLSSQIHKVFANLQKKINSPCADLRVIENGTFYTNLDLIKFLREVGYYFPVNPLINRDFVQKRADGVTYTEFSYGLLQAYDFLTLFEKYDCVGQIGGSDQWSNITSGTELIRKKLGKHSFGCTLPLLTTRDGKKFGKTEGNALFLDKAKTKSYDIYQYCYNLPDDEIEKLLYRLTFVPTEKIIETLNLPLETRSGQKLLAYEIISTLHGDQEAKNTQRISEILFKEDYNNIIHSDLEALSEYANKIMISQEDVGKNIIDVLKEKGVSQSKKDIRRLMENGSVKVNGQVCKEESKLKEFSPVGGLAFVITTGKKKMHLGYLQ